MDKNVPCADIYIVQHNNKVILNIASVAADLFSLSSPSILVVDEPQLCFYKSILCERQRSRAELDFFLKYQNPQDTECIDLYMLTITSKICTWLVVVS